MSILESATTASRKWSDGALPPDHLILGSASSMDEVRRGVSAAAGSNHPVLIRGASGTGKEILAKFIHRTSSRATEPFVRVNHPAIHGSLFDRTSNRRAGPFVRVNCPAIPASPFECEMFGYERGAFLGAYVSKPGLVELARGGTLFFDEVAELDTVVQAKLLQLEQDGHFSRLGGSEEFCADVRIICATGRNLEQLLGSGAFRQDLYYRINVITLELPPLRERQADILPLAEYFAKLYERRFARKVPALSNRIQKLLLHYEWPGHIRQLENVIKRFVVLGDEESITEDLLPDDQPTGIGEIERAEPLSLKQRTRMAVQELERKLILESLFAHNWNRRAVARDLQISYRSLYLKLKQAGVTPTRRPSNKSANASVDPELVGQEVNEDTP